MELCSVICFVDFIVYRFLRLFIVDMLCIGFIKVVDYVISVYSLKWGYFISLIVKVVIRVFVYY